MTHTKTNLKTTTEIKLAALWASLVGCYIYCDFFGLFVKGAILKMNDGMMGPLGVATPQVLIGVSIMMAIPCLMIAMSVILPNKLAKILNLVFAACFIIIQGLTIPGSEPFYILFSIIEIGLLCTVFYLSLKWRITE